jgi:hypothetical protein
MLTPRPRHAARRLALLLLQVMSWGALVAPGLRAEGPAPAVVVLPRAPTPVERFAAEELRRCLSAALDWDVRAALAPPGTGVVLHVGTVESPSRLAPAVAARVAARAEELVEDGVYLHAADRNVVLAGKGARGALNAVYTFLEQRVGYHWPEPSQEFVPRGAPVQLDGLDLMSNPAFPYRGIAIHGACGAEWFSAILDWLSKNRMNAFQLFPGHYEQLRPAVLAEVRKRGLYPNIGGHSREFFFPAARYFAPHREWFALVKGERVADTQICYSELASVPDYAANVVAYLRTRPEIEMVSLWPSDGYGFCECERCQAGFQTDTILNYVNAVTREVVAACPGVETEFLSYIDYTVPPRAVKPLPEVVPTYCEYWSRSQFHPITDDRSGNAQCREQLKAWIAASRQATLFSYYGDDCIKRFVYNPLMDMVATDMRYYRSIGLSGNFVLLTNPESWWSHAPHLYAYTRFAWDPDTPLAAVEDDYYDALYGAAAPAMRDHAAASRALFGLTTVQGGTGEDVVWGQSFPDYDPAKDAATRQQGAAAVAGLRACLQRATATEPGPYVRQRIAKLEADADYLAWVWEFACEARMAALTGTPDAKESLLQLAAKGLDLEVIAEDDRRGYRSARNVLLDTSRRVAGAEPVGAHGGPAARREYETGGIWLDHPGYRALQPGPAAPHRHRGHGPPPGAGDLPGHLAVPGWRGRPVHPQYRALHRRRGGPKARGPAPRRGGRARGLHRRGQQRQRLHAHAARGRGGPALLRDGCRLRRTQLRHLRPRAAAEAVTGATRTPPGGRSPRPRWPRAPNGWPGATPLAERGRPRPASRPPPMRRRGAPPTPHRRPPGR